MDKVEMNKVIAEFMEIPYKPVKAGYERGSSYVSIDRKFKTLASCLKYCDEINAGGDPDDCFFPLPDTPKFKLQYHESYSELMPVWVKFRDLKFETLTVHQRTNFEIHTYIIGNAILKEPITEAHKLLFEAIQWYNSINTIKKEK